MYSVDGVPRRQPHLHHSCTYISISITQLKKLENCFRPTQWKEKLALGKCIYVYMHKHICKHVQKHAYHLTYT